MHTTSASRVSPASLVQLPDEAEQPNKPKEESIQQAPLPLGGDVAASHMNLWSLDSKGFELFGLMASSLLP